MSLKTILAAVEAKLKGAGNELSNEGKHILNETEAFVTAEVAKLKTWTEEELAKLRTGAAKAIAPTAANTGTPQPMQAPASQK